MTFAKEASKLLTNKYFLYFMVFLASTNILGYLVTNKTNAVIFFALVSFLTYNFSKNMAVVLLVGIIATNFMMANKLMREGLENQDEDSDALEKAKGRDGELADIVSKVQNSATSDEIKQKILDMKNGVNSTLSSDDSSTTDLNNPDLNKNISGENVPEGVGEKLSSKKKTTNENFGPRLDYAATIEQSYQNLDSILGSDSIKQLTGDTQKLMAQQQNLFNTMNQMVPVLEGAQDMLKKFNVEGLTSSLSSMSKMGGATTINAAK